MTLQSVKRYAPATALTIDSAALTGSFASKGTIPVGAVFAKIINCSNQAVEISFDGTNVNDAAPASGVSQIGPTSSGEEIAAIPKGLTVYARGTAGTGNIYIVTYGVSE